MSPTLGALADARTIVIGDGYRTRRPEHGQPGYRILRVADVIDGTVRLEGSDFVSNAYARSIGPKLSRPDDVLLTTKGTVGRVALYPGEAEQVVYSPQLCYFRVIDRTRLLPRYLAYWFRSEAFAEQSAFVANNTDMAAYINLRDIRSLTLDLPPVEQQRAVTEVLGALDDKIAANDKVIALSKDLLRTLYVRSMATGAQKRPMFDVLDVDFGEAFKGDAFAEVGTGRPLIRIRDLKTFSPQTWTTESRANEVLVQPGDVLVGMDAEFRATPWLGEPGLLNQRVCRVRGRTVGPAFAIEALRAPLAAIENEKTGTTVIHLNKSDLARAHVDLPEESALVLFEAQAEPLLADRVARAHENRRLAVTRDALLPLLMSGRLTVKDAEKTVEELL